MRVVAVVECMLVHRQAKQERAVLAAAGAADRAMAEQVHLPFIKLQLLEPLTRAAVAAVVLLTLIVKMAGLVL
jgi:hypothetical protein